MPELLNAKKSVTKKRVKANNIQNAKFLNYKLSNKLLVFFSVLLRFLSYLIFLAFVAGCVTAQQSSFRPTNINSKSTVDFSKLQVGDIIITPADFKNPISWFGHSGIMVGKNNIGEYPNIMAGYVETNVQSWLDSKNQYAVLRYKKINANFKRQLLQNLSNSSNKSYGISNKRNSETFYCSQYIWYLYWKTAQDLGYELDLSDNDEYLILPYEFLRSNQLMKIDISKN